jgi:hypothetical protein
MDAMSNAEGFAPPSIVVHCSRENTVQYQIWYDVSTDFCKTSFSLT